MTTSNTIEKREDKMKAAVLEAVRAKPGLLPADLPQSHKRFLRILEKQDGLIVWRCDDEGKNEGWHPSLRTDEYAQDSVHGDRNK